MKITAKQLSSIIREAVSDAPAELSKEDVILADKTATLLIQARAMLRNASDPRLHEVREQIVALGISSGACSERAVQ